MKKLFIALILVLMPISTFASDIEDTSILDQLEKEQVEQLDFDFNLKTFETCQNLEEVMGNYVKEYWKNNKGRFGGPVLYRNFGGIEPDIMEDAVDESSVQKSTSQSVGVGGGSDDFSETNVQIAGVDESDIIKTDGEYVYYYNQTDKFVYIIKAYPETQAEIVKKIKLPKTFFNPVLYIDKNRLVIVSGGYSQTDYSKRGYWINRNNKTYTVVFDTTDKVSPKLVKMYVSDGDMRKSRKIGNYIYVLSNNHFAFPYHTFQEEDDIQINAKTILPRNLELSKTSNKSKQNLTIKGKKLPYNIKAGSVAGCNEIQYVLPDEETLKQFDFSPSYNIISVIDIRDIEQEVKTKVIAGNNAEIFMSLDNLYLTSNIYQPTRFSCPPNARCISPWFPRGNNTLVHKVNVDGNKLSYQDSAILPGSPLNQYSMDEHKGKFRIITKQFSPELSTDIYILDEKMNLHGQLTGIQPGEEFKSSRFIGDTLYLVTFERTDPFFVISMSDGQNPKILGELKIPGFSTYLHPYDENHLIGLGYDTTENKWGGIIQNGVKLDLYEINWDKKVGVSTDCSKYFGTGWEGEDFKCPEYCELKTVEDSCIETGLCEGWSTSYSCVAKIDDSKSNYIEVKQKYTKTFGGFGSSSEALHNPRLFMWKSDENKLLLPVQLRQNSQKDIYKAVDFFQGLIGVTIDKKSGIKQDYRISHIDTSGLEDERKKECEKYTPDPEELECKILLDGTRYCPTSRKYVPTYCYADSPIGEYLAQRSWQYRNEFVKRALWVGDNAYAVSDAKMTVHDLESGEDKITVNFEIEKKDEKVEIDK